MILQVRGTSGSGKTTAVRHLIREFDITRIVKRDEKGNRVRVYQGQREDGTPIYLLGDYTPGRGAAGCDTISTVQEATDLAVTYGSRHHGKTIVLFEGLLLAHSWGLCGETLHEKFGERYVNAFLDTSIKRCFERVLRRREQKGSVNEPDRKWKIEKNIVADHYRVELCWARVEARGGVRIMVDNRTAGLALADMVNAWEF